MARTYTPTRADWERARRAFVDAGAPDYIASGFADLLLKFNIGRELPDPPGRGTARTFIDTAISSLAKAIRTHRDDPSRAIGSFFGAEGPYEVIWLQRPFEPWTNSALIGAARKAEREAWDKFLKYGPSDWNRAYIGFRQAVLGAAEDFEEETRRRERRGLRVPARLRPRPRVSPPRPRRVRVTPARARRRVRRLTRRIR